MNRHDRNDRGILSSLQCGTTQDNPPKHKSDALLLCVKSLLDVVILTYECQQSVSEIIPSPGGGGPNYRCDCDGYRPDTLGAKLDFKERSCPAARGSTPRIHVHRLSE